MARPTFVFMKEAKNIPTSKITPEMIDQYRRCPERLDAMHGRDAVDEKFERITPQTQVDIPTDERGDVIRGYDETYGL